MKRRGEQPWKTNRARTLRANDTLAESRLWQALKARRLGGWKFVRQLPVGHFFLDFACREVRLAVEVDGATHSTEEERKRDEDRSVILERDGWTIVRVQNVEVFENLDGVLDGLRLRLSELAAGNLHGAAPLPDPLPLAKGQGEREDTAEVIE
jgi:very-short-patch-repair endonuclease